MAEKDETRRLVRSRSSDAEVDTNDAEKATATAKASQQTRCKMVARVIPCGYEAMKTYRSVVDAASSEEGGRQYQPVHGFSVKYFPADDTPPRRACDWLFPRRDPEPIRAAKALKARYDEFCRRKPRKIPRSQIRAANRKIVLQCLEWYNSKHPDDEYEPAPGVVTRRTEPNMSILWTHGNFVARRKRSGCFSFLPAPRTLFFFELLDRDGADEVSTCTPIDEPVTEAYTFLGFPLGRGTRRYGGADCVCKTCYRQFNVPHIGLKRTCACGDSKVESVCKMCYLGSSVLHPIRGGFSFGQESFAKIRW